MKWIALIAGIVGLTGFLYFRVADRQFSIVSPISVNTPVETPLRAYTIDALGQRSSSPSAMTLGDSVETTAEYVVRPFYFTSDSPTTSEGLRGVKKKVSGIAHIPTGVGPFPVIVQFRGYVDPTIYYPGLGTKRSAEVFAKNGFILLAPDFLGYATSDPLSNNIFLDRFETYTTALTLIASIEQFPGADVSRVGIWGHSNGGQIALTALEASQKPFPTTLWAPVTKPFPYSILYYTDDAEDHGKFLRKELAKFESLYDVELFSVPNYIDRLSGPIQLHQGGKDDAVPKVWNDVFVQKLKDAKKDVTYFSYPLADHNMTPDWDTVVKRDVEFFKKYLR